MRASVLVTMSRRADINRGRLHLHRQRFVVADAVTVEAGFDDLATFGIQIVFKESTNLIVEEVRQNLGTCVVAFNTGLWLCFYLQEPVADRLPFDLNRLRRFAQ